MPDAGSHRVWRRIAKTWLTALALAALGSGDAAAQGAAPDAPAVSEEQVIAREAYLYGTPLVESYARMWTESVDDGGSGYRAALGTLVHQERVFAPGDPPVPAPNLDLLRSGAWLDLRAQPLVISVPELEVGRYYGIELVDLTTESFAYLGSRTTGNGAGRYLVAGPSWKGEPPAGVSRVIRSATDFVRADFGIQLFGADDLENARRIQRGFGVTPLDAFLGAPARPASPAAELPKIDPAAEGGLGFLAALDTVLRFGSAPAAEQEWRKQLARIGLGSEPPFDAGTLAPKVRSALLDGLAAGKAELEAAVESARSAGPTAAPSDAAGELLARAVASRLGRSRTALEEAMRPLYVIDAEGAPLDGSEKRYVMNLSGSNLPPVEGFWSLTVYDSGTEAPVDNPIGRYRVDSRSFEGLTRDSSGGVTLHLQHESPGPELEANWLPVPDGPFYMVMRLYWPAEAAVAGTWSPPLVFVETRKEEAPVALPSGADATLAVTPTARPGDAAPALERPTVRGEPTEVRILIFVIDVDEVNSAQQNFAASVYYEARWNDPLLRHKGPGAQRRPATEVWTPRLTIVGQQNAWSSFPELVEVSPDGEVVYRQKLWGRFSQPMDLRDFPLDSQRLTIQIAAVGLREDQAVIVPLEQGSGRHSSIAAQFSVPDFDVVSWKAEPAAYYPFPGQTGTAGFRMEIEMERRTPYFVLKVIIPLCLIVIMSWLPRWIDPSEIGPSIGISTTVFLTLVAYLFAITVLLPRVSYITRMDRFILLSTLMVFASLLQTVASVVLMKRGLSKQVLRVDLWSRAIYPAILAVLLFVSFVR